MNLKNLIVCELQRLVCRKRTLTLIIVTLIGFLFIALFNIRFGVGFYDPMTITSLDALNFTPFILRDFHLFLVLVWCPLLVVESFNKELRSGEYRMVMIRSYSKAQLYLAKMISLMTVIAILTLSLWIIGNVFAFLVLPNHQQTLFFNEHQSYSMAGALFFSFKFYLIEFMMLMAVCGVISLLSLICPNAITSYLGSVFILIFVGFGYVPMEFLIISSKSIFDLLLHMSSPLRVILNLMIVLTIGIGGSYLLYTKEDYLS